MRTVIIIVSIIAIAATIGTIAVGMKSFDGVVVENPYEAGLAWDETYQNKAALGWNVRLRTSLFRTGRNELSLEALDRNGRQLDNVVVSVTTSRPSTRAFDKTYPAVRTANGRLQANIDLPFFGSWDLKIDVSSDKDRCSFTNRIYAEQHADKLGADSTIKVMRKNR
jgi:nitrogen fixation protein FixH